MKDYPKEFIGIHGKKYKLIKKYKKYALYEATAGYKTCFNLETIRRELIYKRDC